MADRELARGSAPSAAALERRRRAAERSRERYGCAVELVDAECSTCGRRWAHDRNNSDGPNCPWCRDA